MVALLQEKRDQGRRETRQEGRKDRGGAMGLILLAGSIGGENVVTGWSRAVLELLEGRSAWPRALGCRCRGAAEAGRPA